MLVNSIWEGGRWEGVSGAAVVRRKGCEKGSRKAVAQGIRRAVGGVGRRGWRGGEARLEGEW